MATALKQIIVAVKGFAVRNKVRNKVRRAAVGAAASAALHVCLLLCLIWQNHTGIHGDSGRYDGAHGLGAGYDPVFAQLVSQQVADARTGALIASQVTEPPMLEPSAPADAGSLMQPARAAFPEAEGEAVQTLETGGAAPGTADSQHTLLEQIARCLPPNERPELKAASLHLSVDGGGNLTAAPRLEVDVTQLTQTQLRSANQIVQAAMQCGPYVVTQGEVAMIDIVPDFTGVPLAGQ